MAQIPGRDDEEAEGEREVRRLPVLSYRSKINPQVTVEWREVTWSEEKRVRFARLILKMLELPDDPPAR